MGDSLVLNYQVICVRNVSYTVYTVRIVGWKQVYHFTALSEQVSIKCLYWYAILIKILRNYYMSVTKCRFRTRFMSIYSKHRVKHSKSYPCGIIQLWVRPPRTFDDAWHFPDTVHKMTKIHRLRKRKKRILCSLTSIGLSVWLHCTLQYRWSIHRKWKKNMDRLQRAFIVKFIKSVTIGVNYIFHMI